jgi:type IV secretory pathway VirB3-like protein
MATETESEIVEALLTPDMVIRVPLMFFLFEVFLGSIILTTGLFPLLGIIPPLHIGAVILAVRDPATFDVIAQRYLVLNSPQIAIKKLFGGMSYYP